MPLSSVRHCSNEGVHIAKYRAELRIPDLLLSSLAGSRALAAGITTCQT